MISLNRSQSFVHAANHCPFKGKSQGEAHGASVKTDIAVNQTDESVVIKTNADPKPDNPDEASARYCKQKQPASARPAPKHLPLCLFILLAASVATVVFTVTSKPPMPPSNRPRALVYRGPATTKGLPEAVAQLLESSPRNFDVAYAGPDEAVHISAESLSAVELYAQPGGPGMLERFLSTAVMVSERQFMEELKQ